MAEYSILEQVKIRRKQFHIETVTNEDDTTYRIVVNRQKEMQKLPKDIKAVISSSRTCIGKEIETSQKTALEAKEEPAEERKCIPMPDRLKEKLKL